MIFGFMLSHNFNNKISETESDFVQIHDFY